MGSPPARQVWVGWEDHLAVICARQGKTLNKALERLKR
jgi:hypothetical protein